MGLNKGENFLSLNITAMKKRGRESILSDSEKVNHKIDGIESPEKDGIKKPKVSIARRLYYGSKLEPFHSFSSHFSFHLYL